MSTGNRRTYLAAPHLLGINRYENFAPAGLYNPFLFSIQFAVSDIFKMKE